MAKIKYWNGSTWITLDANDADTLDGQHGSYYAPVNSPTFTGTPTAPTPADSTDSNQIATTAFVHNLLEQVSVPNLTLTALTLGGRYRFEYNVTEDSLDLVVV